MKTVICVVSLAVVSVANTASAQPPDPRPGPSTPVTVVNTPLPVTGTVSGDVNATIVGTPDVKATIVGTPEVTIASRQVAFTKRLCIPNFCTPASPSSFTVPAATAGGETVKELVVDFVTGLCTGTGRLSNMELFTPNGTIADTGDSFSTQYFPFAETQYNSALGLNGVQSFSQPTHFTYVPGTVVSTTFSIVQAGQNFCRIQLNGHFVTTP